MSSTVFLVVICLILSFVLCEKNCESKESCHACIRELGCSWCSNPYENMTHCQSKTPTSPRWCKTTPQHAETSFQIQKDDRLSAAEGHVVQLKPQRITINLRRNMQFKFNFQYKQAENYPVDLYYLMDLSASMRKHKVKLGVLGKTISETMRKLTNNFRLGFGSFVDKPALPYVHTGKSYSLHTSIAKPYSFKNHLPLIEDYVQFNSKVSGAKLSENIDSPEGGLDALIQAIVCTKDIGWRPQARRLLVFSTDAGFHIAGDGKLAAIVEPNDGECHMVKDEYVGSLLYDYPSVSQINNVAKLNNINLVFAVSSEFTPSVNATYHELSKNIENSNVGTLSIQSDNIVQLIRENYNRIVDSVTMTSNASNDIEINFTADCPYRKENGCTNVHVGDVIGFTAIIRALECSDESDNKKIIAIKPSGLDERIIIELNVQCNCHCESKSDPTFQEKSPKCSGNGNFECGVCSCNRGRYGEQCECDGDSLNGQDVTACQADANNPVCSGLGVCRCNKCACYKRNNPEEVIYGKYCQCSNYNCNRVKNVLCSGNGKCDCGVCKCNAGWTGDACECLSGNGTCIGPGDSEVCSGHGECSCGKCLCTQDDNRYSGAYCEECNTCPSQRCEELRSCVECQTYKSGKYDINECTLKCTSFTTEVVDKFNDTYDPDVKRCRLLDTDGCRIVFQYSYDENLELVVQALKEKVCSGPPDIMAWIAGVIGSVLLAGLVMLIVWKVCTTIHDQREYAKFEKERENLKWHANQNPLYKGATSSYSNPAFNAKSQEKQ